MQEAASRKRKKVPKKGPQLIGEVLDSLAQQNQGRSKGTKGGGKVTRQRAAKRQRRNSSPFEVEMERKRLEELEDDDISDCIVVIP
jgi:hypothetical protein